MKTISTDAETVGITQALSVGINCVKLDITVITSQSIAILMKCDSLSLDCYQKWAVDPTVQFYNVQTVENRPSSLRPGGWKLLE